MHRVNILHLSDLHITKRREVDQQIVLSAFFDDLEHLCDSDLAPHYVVISGDLVNDPDEPNAYNIFLDNLLFPLLEITATDLDNIIFTPGNHDVSRFVCKSFQFEVDALASKLGDHRYFNELYAEDKFPELIQAKSAAYTSFVQSLSARHATNPNQLYNVLHYPHHDLEFVSLNSSLLSLGSLAGPEQGRLIFPDLAANEAFYATKPGRLVISILHHPLSWFQDTSANELQRTISQKSAIHLYGHLHEAIPTNTTSALGTTTFIQSPSLFSSRDYSNGYSIISIAPDRKRICVFFRTYYDPRRSFGDGENVVQRGTYYPNSESRNYWSNQPLRINLKKFRRWLTEHALIEKADYLNETTVQKRLSDIFVCPPLMRIEINHQEQHMPGRPFIYTKVPYDKLFEIAGNIVVYCAPEHGQSSFARQTALNYFLRNAEFELPRLPLIVDCTYLREYEASLLGLLKAQAPDLTSLGKRLEVILEEGLAVVIFENVNPIDRDKSETISAFMSKFEKNQFVFLIRSSFNESIDRVLELQFPNVTDTLHMQPFTRSLVREFIKKWKLPLRASEAITLDQVITRFRELGLPLTPVYLTLLFSVYEQDTSFRPTNTASLVENFVEHVLGKSTGDLSRGSFDYRNQISLLAYLAEKMIRSDNFVISYVDMFKWVDEYLRSIDLQGNSHDLITHFIRSKIFNSIGDNLQFRHDMFLAYFIAQRMISSNEFFKRVTDEPSRFPQEIDIFCGLRRFDLSIVEIVSAKFLDVDKRLKEQFPLLPSLESLDNFELPRDESVEAMFTSVTNQLTSNRISDSDRDKMLDHETKEPAKPKQLGRPEAKYVALEWITTLRSYTMALKNLEEIGADKKEFHLSIILDAWARAVGYFIMLIRMTFDTGLEIAGVKISLKQHFGELTPFIARCLFIVAPTAISGMVRADLGTDKLRHVLSSTDPSGNASVALRFINEALYLDLRLPGYLGRMRQYMESVQDKRYFAESLLVKLQDGFIRFPFEDETSDSQYCALLAELTADVSGKRGRERQGAVAKQMEEMRKRRIVSKLKGE